MNKLLIALVLGSVVAIGCGADPPEVAAQPQRQDPQPDESENPQQTMQDKTNARPWITVAPEQAAPGDIVTLKVHAPPKFVWGLDSYLEIRTKNGWRPLYLLPNYSDQDPNEALPLRSSGQSGPGVRALGLRGDAEFTIRLPNALARGSYRIVKMFTEEGGGPVQERSTQVSTRLRVM